MPNYVNNSLLIAKKHWNKFKEVAIDKNGEVDFGILLPRPVECDIDEFYNNMYTNAIPEGEKEKVKEFGDGWFNHKYGEILRLMDVFHELGLNEEGWYEWQIRHWGTKWNSCDSCIDNEDDIDDLDDEDNVIVRFQTAWSAPEPWYDKLAEVIPFETECTEEGGFFHFVGYSDGEGGFSIEDDTEEYFKQQEEDDE